MTRERTTHVKHSDVYASKGRSAVTNRVLHTMLRAIVGIGITYGLVASMGFGHASESARNPPAKVSDRRPEGPRVASALDTLQRLPGSVRASLQATATLPSKDMCRIAESLLQHPTIAGIDLVAHYLSKDVHRWSDRMITLYLNTDPKLVKATDRGEMKELILRKWESDRGMAQRWLQGCGLVMRTAIRRGRPIIERETPEILADIVSVIAIGLRKNEPDAIAAAEALVRAEQTLSVSTK